jgi:cytochrome P450
MTAQISTFIVAGYDTTSTALTWCLYYLAQNPAIQFKLRQEALSGTEDDFTSLPYLDAVVRESTRRAPPVAGIARLVAEDCVIPLEKPIKLRKKLPFPLSLLGGGSVEGSYRNENGEEMIDSVAVKKGQMIYLSIESFNRSKETWGDDAEEFKPERWIDRKEQMTEGKYFTPVFSDILTL